jgi:hypothetical protein
MESQIGRQLKPGTRLRVIQQIPARDHVWTNAVHGTVVDFRQRTTGSWFAHAKNDKLWLDRLTLRKDDGELITLVLDEFSRVELDVPVAEPTAAPATAAADDAASLDGHS